MGWNGEGGSGRGRRERARERERERERERVSQVDTQVITHKSSKGSSSATNYCVC